MACGHVREHPGARVERRSIRERPAQHRFELVNRAPRAAGRRRQIRRRRSRREAAAAPTVPRSADPRRPSARPSTTPRRAPAPAFRTRSERRRWPTDRAAGGSRPGLNIACSPCSARTRRGSSPHARTICSTRSQNASSPLFQYTRAVGVSPARLDGFQTSVSMPHGHTTLFASSAGTSRTNSKRPLVRDDQPIESPAFAGPVAFVDEQRVDRSRDQIARFRPCRFSAAAWCSASLAGAYTTRASSLRRPGLKLKSAPIARRPSTTLRTSAKWPGYGEPSATARRA